MKAVFLLLSMLVAVTSFQVFAFGGLKRHFMRPPHVDCIGGRFSHICIHHKDKDNSKPDPVDDGPDRPAVLSPCKILESDAPAGQRLKIRLHIGAKNLTVVAKDWNDQQVYYYLPEESSTNKTVYGTGINRPDGAPERIDIVGMDDSEKDHTVLYLTWSGFKETVDCPVP